jgi:hypothetical protein
MGITMVYFYFIARNYEYKTHQELVQLELEGEKNGGDDGDEISVHALSESSVIHPKVYDAKESLTGGQDL